jgi:hypothetical protein
MNPLRRLKAFCVALSCLGLILPPSVLASGPPWAVAGPGSRAPQPAKLVRDVALDPAGSLHGLVADVQGVRVAGAEVVLRRPGGTPIRTHADRQGRFSFDQLRGGVYQVSVGRQGGLIRAWADQTAPPAAQNVALLVVGDDVVRGQMPAEEFFASDAVIITAMVAAMIAIPIVVHNSRPSTP